MASMYDNSTGMIQSGAAQLGQGIAGHFKEQEANAPPSPFEQALARVMAGEDPIQVAKEHKAGASPQSLAGGRNLPGSTQPQLPPSSGLSGLATPMGEQPLGYNEGDAVPQVFADPTKGLGGELNYGGGLGGPLSSAAGVGADLRTGRGLPAMTSRRDFDSFVKMAPYLNTQRKNADNNAVRREGYEVKRDIASASETGKTSRSDSRNETTRYGVDSRAGSADAGMQQRERDSLRRYEVAKNRLQYLKDWHAANPPKRDAEFNDLVRQYKIELDAGQKAMDQIGSVDKGLRLTPDQIDEETKRAEEHFKAATDLQKKMRSHKDSTRMVTQEQQPQQTQGAPQEGEERQLRDGRTVVRRGGQWVTK